jgi:hypothetical protein
MRTPIAITFTIITTIVIISFTIATTFIATTADTGGDLNGGRIR